MVARLGSKASPCLFVALALTLAACGDSDDGTTAGTTSESREAAGATASTEASAAGFPKPRPCRRPAELSPEQTEGPYYRPDPPKRRSLIESSVSGRRFSLRGRVLDSDCRAIARARVDFWQADGNGAYDNNGYRLRGYQLTDHKGRYRVETVAPGLYDERSRHIHVKVTAPGGRTLTTQLYFPGEPQNRSDGIFTPETVVSLRRGSSPWRASFQFIVRR